MSLLRLVYHSVLHPPEEYVGREAELIEEIRQRAAEKNKGMEISGVLLFNEATNELIQVLEGEPAKVKGLYAVIAQDPRHRDVTCHVQIKAKKREYKEWGMLKGDHKDWKIVKMTLPAAVAGVTVATFDEAFVQRMEIEQEQRAALTAAEVPKKKKKGLFSCLSA